MAIVGHWVAAFLVGRFVPQASIVLLCKLSMMSDFVLGFMMLFGLEHLGVYPAWLMSTPPPGTQHMVDYMKSSGRWLDGVDKSPGQNGWYGFGAFCAAYLDLSYSHSVELMAIFAIPIVIYLCMRYSIGLGYAFGVFFALVSHPLLDMVFHDAYFLMGNRAKTRVTFDLWQITWLGPFTFCLEVALAYFPYRMWLSMREPCNDDKNTAAEIAKWTKMFWTISISHNMCSWYVMSPFLQWLFYTWFPQPTFAFGADNFWSDIILALTLWSWTFALYPLHKLESLLVLKREADLEAQYVKVVE